MMVEAKGAGSIWQERVYENAPGACLGRYTRETLLPSLNFSRSALQVRKHKQPNSDGTLVEQL